MKEIEEGARQPNAWQAWQHALAEVPATPALNGALLRRRADLFGRFAAWYERLRSRPRAERRRLQRRFGLSLAGVALLLSLNGSATGASSPAATIVVDGTTCTLVDAITAANTNTATGGCVAGDPGADTIDLQVNVTLTAVNNETYGDTGLPVATSTITIAGNGHTVSRQTGLPDFRIFAVGTGGNLTLNSTTVSGGIAADSSLTNRDGGVYNRNMLTVENSTLLENITAHGGGIINNRGTVTVLNSSLSGNTAARGGGIANNRGTVTVLNSSLSGNLANRYGGGGIHSYSGWLTLQDSTLSGNTADSRADSFGGGAISSYRGGVSISNATISGNSTSVSGGGVDCYYCTLLLVQNSTISDNSAGGRGGGIHNYGNEWTVQYSTLSGNAATDGGGIWSGSSWPTMVQNSTISNNSAHAGGGIMNVGRMVVESSRGRPCRMAPTATPGSPRRLTSRAGRAAVHARATFRT
ncbi:MAG: right-handed parallel beta-helix repeat-containing protein [Caldilineales bacterium]